MVNKTTGASFLAFSILFVIGFLIYGNSLDAPFYLDDFRNITENRYLQIDSISWQSLFDAGLKSPSGSRPFPNISFALNQYFHLTSPSEYRSVNILVHIFTAFFLFLLFRATFSLAQPGFSSGRHTVVSLFASLLWLVNPLHTSTVVYIVQRMTLMAAMFYVLSLLCYVYGRMAKDRRASAAWFVCSLLAALLAFGSKQITVTLPFFIVLYEWYFFRDLDRRWWKQFTAVFFLLSLAAILVYFFQEERIWSLYNNRPFTPLQRVLTEWRIVLLYLSLLVFPHPSRLNLDHYIALSNSLLQPLSTLFSFAVIAVLLVVALLSARRWKLGSFAIVWYFGNLAIESSFIGLELIFEHRVYLPSIFLFMAFVSLLFEYLRPRYLAVGGLVAVIALNSYWTVERNRLWKDPVLFWSDSSAKSPQKARPFMNLSVALREKGRIDEAIVASQKAISLDPGFVNAYIGLGAAYAAKGEFARAEAQYLKALQLMPDYADVYNALGILYMKQGKMQKALGAFDENLRLDPEDVNSLVNRASVMAMLGNVRAAIVDFQKASQLEKRNPDILFNLAIAYERAGEVQKSIHCYEEILQLNPDDREAQENLQLLRSGR